MLSRKDSRQRVVDQQVGTAEAEDATQRYRSAYVRSNSQSSQSATANPKINRLPLRPLQPYRQDWVEQQCDRQGTHIQPLAVRLQTARELLWNDDKLSIDERESLWGLLQYVMSDPKSDLVPAKRKRIDIKLGGAVAPTREFIENIIAKSIAETLKPR